MYKLFKPEIKETKCELWPHDSHIDVNAFPDKFKFKNFNIVLYDEDNNLYSDVYHHMRLFSYTGLISRLYNKLSFFECFFTFETLTLSLRKREEYDSYDIDTLVDLIEDKYKLYMGNLNQFIEGDIKFYKNNQGEYKIWSDSNFLITIFPIEENLSKKHRQDSKLYITMSKILNVNDKFVYTIDYDLKQRKTLPKKFKIITKNDFDSIIRKNYIKVANRFLSQDFDNTIYIPGFDDIVYKKHRPYIKKTDPYIKKIDPYDEEEWGGSNLSIEEFWKNRTVFKDIIKN